MTHVPLFPGLRVDKGFVPLVEVKAVSLPGSDHDDGEGFGNEDGRDAGMSVYDQGSGSERVETERT